ncbi:helix-turn-helix domain-containing protein [Enterococcus sp. AZ109]|uniref:helix-turn-helix domain-containing protein n=1 Tax=Enterococcus sp. AZ109 TaxID=2774634 RepID=UPI003F299D11
MDLRELMKQETYRRLCLIEALYYSESLLSVQHLSDLLGCSVPILHSDIKALNENDLQFTIIKIKNLYKLNFEASATIDSVYANILETSVEFQIISELFFQRQYRISAIATDLRCSFSNVQRHLKRIEQLLPNWNIHVAQRPSRIEGDEIMIRHFYYLFFKERRLPLKSYGFSDKLILAVDHYIHEFLLKNNVRNNMNTHLQLMHSTLICLYRNKKKFHLDAQLPSDHYFRLPNKSEHSDLVLLLKRECGLEYNSDLMMEALWPVFSDHLVLTPSQQMQQEKTNYKLANFYDLHTKLMRAINLILENSLTESQIQESLRILGNDVLIYFPDNELITILGNSKHYTLLLLRKKYGRTVDRLMNTIYDFLYKNRLPYSEEYCELYFFSLIQSIDGLLQRFATVEKPVKVLLLSDASPNQEKFWRLMLSSWVQTPLFCSYSNYPYINMQDLNQVTKKFDLLITDITMPELESFCPVIAINSYPTPQDIANIRNFFNSLDTSIPDRKETEHEPTLST